MLFIDKEAVAAHLPYDKAVVLTEQALVNLERFNNGPKNPFYIGVNRSLIGSLYSSDVKGGYALCKTVGIFDTIVPEGGNHQGIITLFDLARGVVVACLDAAEVTAIRTAAATVAATQIIMGSRTPSVHLVVGTGEQALRHLMAFNAVFPSQSYILAARKPEPAMEIVSKVNAVYGRDNIEIIRSDNLQSVTAHADIITLVTNSCTPLLTVNHTLKQGAHINTVGACLPSMVEVDEQVMREALVFSDDPSLFAQESGNYAYAKRQGIEIEAAPVSRASSDDLHPGLTLYSSTGNGAQDLVCAQWLYEQVGL